ncbi:hypothetical protein [Botrimarina sp.]|uniref:hypothetical protein n=1 Tax=Botrimarina sp. TaxID=2795802 RepID=UPI0032ED2DE2
MDDAPTLKLLAVAADAQPGLSVAELVARQSGETAAPAIATTVADALARLRSEPFDAILALHEPPRLDALTLAKALRGAGDETPLAVVGHASPIDLEAAVWDAGADEYACLAQTSAEQLAGRLRRAIDARRRTREARRLLVAEQRRLEREAEEATQLLLAQQRLVAALAGGRAAASDRARPTLRLAGAASDRYTQFAEASLVEDRLDPAAVRRLAESLADEGASGPELLEAHLAAIDRVTHGAPAAGARRLRSQADRLLLEATLLLAEAYRERYVRATESLARTTPAARAA